MRIRKYAIMVNQTQCDRNVREVVREIDAHNISAGKVVRIFKEKWELVDVKSQKVFMLGAAMGAIKCAVRWNHSSTRHSIINNKSTMEKYLRCEKNETQEHFIQYIVVFYRNEAFGIKLRSKLEKVAETDEEKNSMKHIVSDVWKYLNGIEEDCVINQKMLG